MIKGTDYQDTLWSKTTNRIRTIVNASLKKYNTYIAPEYTESGNCSIRIWPTTIELVEMFGNTGWRRRENFEIVYYEKTSTDNYNFYEQFFTNFDEIYQFMFNETNEDNPGGSGNSLYWFDGKVDSVVINELTDDESEINGLHSIKLNFSCITTNIQ